jgi:hypothetical protein
MCWSLSPRLAADADADARKVVFVAKGRDALTVAGFAPGALGCAKRLPGAKSKWMVSRRCPASKSTVCTNRGTVTPSAVAGNASSGKHGGDRLRGWPSWTLIELFALRQTQISNTS